MKDRGKRKELEYCNDKPCYDKKGAQSAKNFRMRSAHTILRIYNCPDCNLWHLTSKDVRVEKKTI